MIKLKMLVFDKRRKPEYLGKNLSEQEQEPPHVPLLLNF